MSVTPEQKTRAEPSATPNSIEIQVARHVFDVMNNDRVANNLPALEWDDNLARAARVHNFVMADHGELSHQLPNEPELGNRLSNQNVQWQTCGENVAYYQPVTDQTAQQKAEELHKAMLNEVPPDDGHRRNKLSKDFKRVGVDIYIDANQRLWLTEDFAG